MKTWTIHKESKINATLSQVFEFFSKAENLEKLTPEFLNFKILTPPPIKMKKGLEIDYEIRLYGFPIRWKTLIEEWNPPHLFIDTQLSGPYSLWHHTHKFTEENGYTIVQDDVVYRPKGFIFAGIINHLFVKKDIEKIFNYREKTINSIFKS